MAANRKKRVFIGSSTETKELARNIKQAIETSCDCSVWYDDFFELGNYVFNDLIQKAVSYDYAILIGGADDKGGDGVTNKDALRIQMYKLSLVSEL